MQNLKTTKKMHYSYISFFGGSLLLSLEKTKKNRKPEKTKKMQNVKTTKNTLFLFLWWVGRELRLCNLK